MIRWRHRLEGLLLGLLVAIAIGAFSEPYFGVAIGRSHASIPSDDHCEGCSTNEISFDATVGGGFVGYRAKWLAGEAGAGTLSGYSSHRVGPLPDGVMRDIRQEIWTSQIYLRAIAYAPKLLGVEPFASVGYTRVKMKNHEWGYNDPTRDFVEQVNYDTRTKPFFGAGIQAPLTERVALRAELTHVRHVAVSHWTLEQNVTAAWLGLVFSLGGSR